MCREEYSVSAYIPCFNSERYIGEAIEALLAQTVSPSEILVIDDGSTDRTAAIVSQYPVRLIQHKHNRGLAAARNTALKEAKHALVANIDADVVVAHDWLQRLLEALFDNNVVGAGGRLIERFQDSRADHWRVLHLPQDLGAEKIVIRGKSERSYLSGFGSLYQKNVLQKVGGYNQLYRTNYEDTDMGRRLLQAGYGLVYEPEAIAYHIRRDTSRSVVRAAWAWDFWPQYHANGYNCISHKLYRNLCWEYELVTQHLGEGNVSLLLVDAIYLVLYCYWDLCYCLSSEPFPLGLAPCTIEQVDCT